MLFDLFTFSSNGIPLDQFQNKHTRPPKLSNTLFLYAFKMFKLDSTGLAASFNKNGNKAQSKQSGPLSEAVNANFVPLSVF